MNIICVAGFIPTATSTGIPGFVYFQGDNRDFSSDSPKDASRFWLWINADTGEIVGSQYHPTQRVTGPNGTPLGDPYPPRNTPDTNLLNELIYGSNKLSTSKADDGSITLHYKAVCSDPICNNGLAADGTITFRLNGHGSYDSVGAVNTFPNLEAYHWNEGSLQSDSLFQMQHFTSAEREAGHADIWTSFGMALSTNVSSHVDSSGASHVTYWIEG